MRAHTSARRVTTASMRASAKRSASRWSTSPAGPGQVAEVVADGLDDAGEGIKSGAGVTMGQLPEVMFDRVKAALCGPHAGLQRSHAQQVPGEA